MQVQSVTPEIPTAESGESDLADVIGGWTDRRLALTTFANAGAKNRREHALSLRQLATSIHGPVRTEKAKLPWLKLAKFGDVASDKGSLRHNGNILTVDGIEGDHDAGTLSVEAAACMVRAAGLAALIYTSPSHTPDTPRWRILCPTSAPLPPAERERLCARLNGALAGELAPESFTLSQSYYYGRIEGASTPEAMLIEGAPIDLASALDAAALDRNREPYRKQPAAPEHVEDDDEWHLAPDWLRIDSALAAIPVTAADAPEGRELWLRVGMALHSAGHGNETAFAKWDAWSKPGAKYKAKDQRAKWESFGRGSNGGVTVASLYHLAEKHGWNPKTGEMRAPPRLRFLAPEDCAASPNRGYVVKGLLAPRDVACIYGAPGAGKSLIAPHLGYMAALGSPAFGMRTRAGRTFYIAAEDPHGMRGRVTALKLKHGDAPDFLLVEGVTDLLDPDSPDLAALHLAVEQQTPALIFIDTLAMAFPGLEENTAEDMGRVVAIARKLTEWGAAVVLIHHDTKSQTPTPRGHSLLNGALDIALQLFPKDEMGVVRGKLSKNRNGSSDRDIAFRIATIELGIDDDGDAISVAVVDELAAGLLPKRERMSASESAALDIFEDLRRAGAGEVSEDAWRTACIESRSVSGSDERESRRKATKRAFEGLVRKGVIDFRGDFVFHAGGGSYAGNGFDEEPEHD